MKHAFFTSFFTLLFLVTLVRWWSSTGIFSYSENNKLHFLHYFALNRNFSHFLQFSCILSCILHRNFACPKLHKEKIPDPWNPWKIPEKSPNLTRIARLNTGAPREFFVYILHEISERTRNLNRATNVKEHKIQTETWLKEMRIRLILRKFRRLTKYSTTKEKSTTS